jgi:hypothetical protein
VGALRQSTEGRLSVVDQVLRAQVRGRRARACSRPRKIIEVDPTMTEDGLAERVTEAFGL